SPRSWGIAPSTYHAARSRPASARAVRDAELRPEILGVWEQNLSGYGADKIWDQLNKDGIDVARCTVERLMADLGRQGCRRGTAYYPQTNPTEEAGTQTSEPLENPGPLHGSRDAPAACPLGRGHTS